MAKNKYTVEQKQFSNMSFNDGSIQILQLALFMMLLAFFIVLTSTSNYEKTRVQPVMQSLYKAFYSEKAPRIKTEITEQKPIDEITTYLEREQTIEYLTRLFKSELPSLTLKTNSDLGVMQAYFDRSTFETQIKSKQSTVIDKVIAGLIYIQQTEKPYSMEITLRQNNDETEAQRINKINLLEDYVQILSRRGLLPKLLVISLSNQIKDDVVLTFKPYFKFAPKQIEKRGEN